MLTTKIVTCLLGLALLLPLTASFWLMIRCKPMTEVELQKSLDEAPGPVRAEIDSLQEQRFPAAQAASVEIYDQLTLPFVGHRFWLFTPRFWVGIVGFVCCLIIVGLWIYSSVVPAGAISGGIGSSGISETPLRAADDSQGEIIIDDAASENR